MHLANLKARNSYLQNSQGQKLTLRMGPDRKKWSNFLFVAFRNWKLWLICLLAAYLFTFMISWTREARFGAPKFSLEWYDISTRCDCANLEKALPTLRKQKLPCENKADLREFQGWGWPWGTCENSPCFWSWSKEILTLSRIFWPAERCSDLRNPSLVSQVTSFTTTRRGAVTVYGGKKKSANIHELKVYY